MAHSARITRTRTTDVTVREQDGEYLVSIGAVTERRPCSPNDPHAYLGRAEAAASVARWFHGLSESHPVSTRIDYESASNSTTFKVTFAVTDVEYIN